MTTSLDDHDLRAELRLLDAALAERTGQAPVPDLTDAIRARLQDDEPIAPSRRSRSWLTAAALLLGVLATLAIALGARQDGDDAARQDPVEEPIEYLPFDPTDPEATLPADATAVAILCINPDEAKQVSLAALADHPALRHARVDVTYILGPLRAELTDPPAGWLAPLASCRKLETLQVSTVHPAVSELSAFRDHPTLRELSLHHPAAWGPRETAILARLPALDSLTLSGVTCPEQDPSGLSTLGLLKDLQSLALEHLEGFTTDQQAGLGSAFERLSRLRSLTLGASPLPAQLGMTRHNPDYGQSLSREFVNALSKLPALTDLAILDVLVTPSGSLKLLPSGLQHLTLQGLVADRLLEVPPLFVVGLHDHAALDSLALLPSADANADAERTSQQVADALALHSFRHLHLRTPITPALAERLATQDTLESLTLTQTSTAGDDELDLSWLDSTPQLTTLRLQASEEQLDQWFAELDPAEFDRSPGLRRLLVTTTRPEFVARLRSSVPDRIAVDSANWVLDR